MTKRSSSEAGEDQRSKGSKKKGRLGKIIKRTLVIGVSAVLLIVGTTFFLARSEPSYWKEHQRFIAETSPTRMQALANEVEAKIDELSNLGLEEAQNKRGEVESWMQSLTRPTDQPTDDGQATEEKQETVRPEDVKINVEKKMTLTNEQLAAIVQTRFDDWMKERGYERPKEMQDPMVAVQDDDLVMAFRLESGSFSAVISGKFYVEILDNGMAELTLRRFLVGQLPVPSDMLGEHLRSASGGDSRMQQIGEWLGKLQFIEIKPVLEIENRRRARIMDYKIIKDGLELSVRVQDHKTYKSMNEALAGVPTD